MSLALAGILFLCSAASAQETGSVTGTVYDPHGSPIVGATVRISTAQKEVERTVLTSEKGAFGFFLPPGEYEAEVEKAGIGKTSRPIVVGLGRETRADFILGALVTVPVAVTGVAAPDIDLKSPELNFTYQRAIVQDLPLERSYLGLMQLIPGVPENTGYAPNGGGSQKDNTYLLDSVNITNPFFGYLSTEVNELDIAELDVKRGAIRPEFGRSTGLISNALIKSGTNLFSGNYRFEAIPGDWQADSTKVVHSRTDRWNHAGDIGGPILKNQMFFYGSVNILRSSTPDAENLFGPLPDRVEKVAEGFGKSTLRVGAQHLFNGGYRQRATSIDNAGIGAYDAPEVASNVDGTSRIGQISYDWFAGARSTVSVRYTHLDEDSSSVPVRDLGVQPDFDVEFLGDMGHLVQGAITLGAASLRLNRQEYSRDEIKAVVSHLVEAGRISHQLKVGFGWDRGVEDLERLSNGWGDISRVFIDNVERIRATYYPNQPSQHSTGTTYSLFGQDDFTVGSRLTVNAGLLLNRDEFVQAVTSSAAGSAAGQFPTFGFFDEIQPRVGLTLQVRKGKGDKVYANWGRYFGLDQKSSARAAASGRLYTEDADFDIFTSALVSKVVSANTGPKIVAQDLRPPMTNEVVLGYATSLPDGWSLDAFWLSRRSHDFIEDIPTVLPFSNFQIQNDPYAERTYRTVTFEVKRRLQNQWAMNLSYAWSRLSGNYDQDYSGDFLNPAVLSTASLIDDGPGAFTTDNYRSGPLSQDRTHLYKVLATWMPKQVSGLSLGVFVRGQSGTPWEARGLPWNSGLIYLRVLEPLGTSRNPFWTNVDQLAKYTIPLSAKRALHFEGRLLNLFNQETALLVDQRKYLGARNLAIAGTPPQGCWSCFTDAFVQNTAEPNANLGRPVAYARTRRLLVSVLLDF